MGNKHSHSSIVLQAWFQNSTAIHRVIHRRTDQPNLQTLTTQLSFWLSNNSSRSPFICPSSMKIKPQKDLCSSQYLVEIEYDHPMCILDCLDEQLHCGNMIRRIIQDGVEGLKLLQKKRSYLGSLRPSNMFLQDGCAGRQIKLLSPVLSQCSNRQLADQTRYWLLHPNISFINDAYYQLDHSWQDMIRFDMHTLGISILLLFTNLSKKKDGKMTYKTGVENALAELSSKVDREVLESVEALVKREFKPSSFYCQFLAKYKEKESEKTINKTVLFNNKERQSIFSTFSTPKRDWKQDTEYGRFGSRQQTLKAYTQRI